MSEYVPIEKQFGRGDIASEIGSGRKHVVWGQAPDCHPQMYCGVTLDGRKVDDYESTVDKTPCPNCIATLNRELKDMVIEKNQILDFIASLKSKH